MRLREQSHTQIEVRQFRSNEMCELNAIPRGLFNFFFQIKKVMVIIECIDKFVYSLGEHLELSNITL